MSADELRQAAATLRERLMGATSGPWFVGMDPETQERVVIYSEFVATRYPDVDPGVAVVTTIQHPQEGDPEEKAPEWGQTTDAAFIATFSPEVADALAEVLDGHAEVESSYECEDERADGSCPIIDLARLINGGAA